MTLQAQWQTVKNLCGARCRLRCDNAPSIMAAAEKVKATMPDRVVVETTPRHSSASNKLSDTTRRIVTRRDLHLTQQSGHGWSGTLGFASRDTHVEKVASHRSRQRTTEIIRKILFRLHHEGDTAWDKGIWLGKSETNPEHIFGTKNGAMGARTIRRLEPTKRSETSLLLEIQGVFLGLGTERTASWETARGT